MKTRSLLLGDTEGAAGTASGFGALTTDLDTEIVTETSVLASLLHALEILTEAGVDVVRNELSPLAVTDAALSVEEPIRNVVLSGFGNNIGNLFNILLGEFTSALVKVNLGNLESQNGETTTETLDDSQGEGCLLLSLNVGVLHTQNVHVVIRFGDNEARLNVVKYTPKLTIFSLLCS